MSDHNTWAPLSSPSPYRETKLDRGLPRDTGGSARGGLSRKPPWPLPSPRDSRSYVITLLPVRVCSTDQRAGVTPPPLLHSRPQHLTRGVVCNKNLLNKQRGDPQVGSQFHWVFVQLSNKMN